MNLTAKNKSKEIELLAPARNLEYVKTAVKCGADAVYMASAGYGLRCGLDNNLKDIEKSVNFAHKYWAKVYITVNTLIYDRNFPEVEKLIKNLYEIGVDAIIIQDMGLLELDLPPIPLFASTNTYANTWEKIDFLEKVGFQRIILPRELNLQEIKEIKSKTNIDLESFVYGLLCVGLSSRCYLNFGMNIKNTDKAHPIEYYQQRAASVGKCDMHCLDTYSLVDSQGKVLVEKDRLLNLHFLDLSTQIESLIDAGITSFKIEGRHKELDYVKNIVSLYRQKVDEVLEKKRLKKPSSGKSIISFTPGIDKTFHKGYTDFFLHGRKKEMYSINKIVGEFVGKIVNIKGNSFKLDSNIQLSKGDKLRYHDSNNIIKKLSIEKVQKGRFFSNDVNLISEGTPVYRYFNQKALNEINNAKIKRVIPVNFKLKQINDNFVLSAVDENNVEAYNQIKINSDKSCKVSPENIKEILKKTDRTEFFIENIEINIDKMPAEQDIIKLRKGVLAKLRQARIANYPRLLVKIEKNNYKYPYKKISYLDNVVNSKAVDFYKRHGVDNIEPGLETGKDLEGKEILSCKYCIKNELDLCTKTNPKKDFVEPLYLVDENNNKYRLRFDCNKCEMAVIF